MSELSAIRSKLGVRSVQRGSINIANATGGTAAISSVSTGRAFVISGGSYGGNGFTTYAHVQYYLNSATEVKVDSGTTNNGSLTWRYEVVEMKG